MDSNASTIQVEHNALQHSVPRVIYSQIAINYNTKSITATTNSQLDKTESRSEKSSDNLATEIKQLF